MARRVRRSACAPCQACSALKKRRAGRADETFRLVRSQGSPRSSVHRHSTSLNCARMEPVAAWPNVSLSTSTTDGLAKPLSSPIDSTVWFLSPTLRTLARRPLHRVCVRNRCPHCVTRISRPAFRQLCTSQCVTSPLVASIFRGARCGRDLTRRAARRRHRGRPG